MKNNYDKFPFVQVTPNDSDCIAGWEPIAAFLQSRVTERSRCVLVVESYPGVDLDELQRELVARLGPDACLLSADVMKDAKEIESQFASCLGNDPVFALMQSWKIKDFFSPERLQTARLRLRSHAMGLTVVLGAGAAEIAQEWDLLVYADLARWEIQRRQREHRIGSLGVKNSLASSRELYKRAYFIDWRVADAIRVEVFEKIDAFLDNELAHVSEACFGKAVSSWHRKNMRSAVPSRAVFRSWTVGWRMDAETFRPTQGATELCLVLRLRSRGKQPKARIWLTDHRSAGDHAGAAAPGEIAGI